MVKNLPAIQETWVQSLDQEDHLVEEMATHSSILAEKTPPTEDPSGYSPQSRKESDRPEGLSLHTRTLFVSLQFKNAMNVNTFMVHRISMKLQLHKYYLSSLE